MAGVGSTPWSMPWLNADRSGRSSASVPPRNPYRCLGTRRALQATGHLGPVARTARTARRGSPGLWSRDRDWSCVVNKWCKSGSYIFTNRYRSGMLAGGFGEFRTVIRRDARPNDVRDTGNQGEKAMSQATAPQEDRQEDVSRRHGGGRSHGGRPRPGETLRRGQGDKDRVPRPPHRPGLGRGTSRPLRVPDLGREGQRGGRRPDRRRRLHLRVRLLRQRVRHGEGQGRRLPARVR